MDKEYILGVDAGGTKTDYLIFTRSGEPVDTLHVGSRSHEVLDGGFAAVEELVLKDIDELLMRNGISKARLAAAAFGMAGIDTPAQLARIKAILNKASLRKFIVSNDSILGIKAGCPSGVGICSVNGTGSVASGIDDNGAILQVGGLGFVSGDYAGGPFIASLAVRAVYDSYFRCGDQTELSGQLMGLLELSDPHELLNVISGRFSEDRKLDKEIVTILFDAANHGDAVAVKIVREIADQLAKSVSGCIRNLQFKDTPEVVLAGSIWTKGDCPLLLSHFKECIYLYTGQRVNPLPLQVIPAVGAVIWATELACGHPATPEQRAVILRNMTV